MYRSTEVQLTDVQLTDVQKYSSTADRCTADRCTADRLYRCTEVQLTDAITKPPLLQDSTFRGIALTHCVCDNKDHDGKTNETVGSPVSALPIWWT